MRKPTFHLPSPSVFAIALCLLVWLAIPAFAADLPTAEGSPLVGFQFDDRPLMLPTQENFQMALLTASSELGRRCGKTESYGWRMKQNEQGRVDQIFNNTVDRLRGLGYVVELQSPSSVSHDVTLFTADRDDHHFLFMWSAGEIGLVMVLCESSPPLINRDATASYLPNMPTPKAAAAAPSNVMKSEMQPLPHATKAEREAAAKFSPIGSWVGSYTCGQGFTGGTLTISSLKGENFTGTFRFYPTPKNAFVQTGSYNVYGQYDRVSHRILINPGKWIKRPHGYYDTIIVGSFDPAEHSFSGTFQGIMGCTSFEARSGALLAHEKTAAHKNVVHQKKAKAKKKTSKKVEAAPLSPMAPASKSGMPAPDPGIAMPGAASEAKGMSPAASGPSPAPAASPGSAVRKAMPDNSPPPEQPVPPPAANP